MAGQYPMTVGRSYREILSSSSLIGASSLVSILLGVLRTKVAAVYLGPAGVGLLGLYSNIVATASNLSSLGTGTAGTKRIAEASARGDAESVAIVRKGLGVTAAAMAVLGAILLWILREPAAQYILRDSELAPEVGWLSVGVAVSVIASAQAALLNGLRRIRDMAALNIAGPAAGAVVGIPILLLFGRDGLVGYFLVGLIATLGVGYFLTLRLPHQRSNARLIRLWHESAGLVRLGSAFMVGGLAVTVGNLAVRAIVQRELGSSAVGHFEAAWTMSMTYMGLLLRAMGADYFPRLTGALNDPPTAVRVVNEQTEVLLVLAMPVLIGISALAPTLVQILYSPEFRESAAILRLQVIGDTLKVVSWPLGMVILAAGDGRSYFFAETFAIAVFVVVTWASISHFGLNATGIAFVAMYAAYLPLVLLLARSRLRFRFNAVVKRDFSLLFAGCAGPLLLAQYFPVVAAFAGSALFVVSGIYAVRRLHRAMRT